MTAARLDLVIEKRAKFYREINLVYSDGSPRSLVGKKIKCIIRESYETETALHTLTEANSGIEVLDDALGKVALVIFADNTDVNADYGVYDVIEYDELFPDEEIDRILQGRITYDKGSS